MTYAIATTHHACIPCLDAATEAVSNLDAAPDAQEVHVSRVTGKDYGLHVQHHAQARRTDYRHYVTSLRCHVCSRTVTFDIESRSQTQADAEKMWLANGIGWDTYGALSRCPVCTDGGTR